MRSLKSILLCASSLALLAACNTTSGNTTLHSSSGNKIDAALERVAARSSQQESLPILETIYKRNSSDPQAALSYAQALRHAGHVDRAVLVLTPFARQSGGSSAVQTEYAALQLTLGNYFAAEEFAGQAVEKNDQDYEAFHYLGIAQDARGFHQEAEASFRKALKHWAGDPVPVLNNLALNLATQRQSEEAVSLIAQASALAPHRRDIDNNQRIILALQERYASVSLAPKPVKKPS